MKKILLNPVGMLVSGLLLGVISRLLDIYTTNLGNVFSQLAIWILLGVLISIYSPTQKKAMFHIFLFCIGMLVAYYGTAVLTNGVYSRTMIVGWTLFAVCSPLFAYFTWLTKRKGLFPKMISTCIVVVSLFSSVLLFDGLRIYDVIINVLLIYFLFFKRIKRSVL